MGQTWQSIPTNHSLFLGLELNPGFMDAYLDYNASAPVVPDVAHFLRELDLNSFGNPSSPHSIGRSTRQIIEEARTRISRIIHQSSDNIFFTSGATESIQSVFHHFLVSSKDMKEVSVAIPTTEHSASIAAAAYLEKQGASVIYIPIDNSGKIQEDSLLKAMNLKPTFISICAANNETGVLADVKAICALTKKNNIPLHLDATQWIGKLDWPFFNNELIPEFISFSAHKLGGLTGCGALVVAPEISVQPLIPGGGQELGFRGGTENVLGIYSFGLAIESTLKTFGQDLSSLAQKTSALRDQFEEEIRKLIPNVVVHGSSAPRLPNTSCLSIPNQDAETLVHSLSQRGIAISSGSACSTSKPGPSHVLSNMNIDQDLLDSAIRVSFGGQSSANDLDRIIQELKHLVA